MNQLNCLTIEGKITSITGVKETPQGLKYCNFFIEVSRLENKQIVLNKFEVLAFNKKAEYVERRFKSNNPFPIRIVGRLKEERLKASDGTETSKTVIIAEHIE